MEKGFKRFVLGSGSFPDWFEAQVEQGRARVEYDEEDGVLLDVVIYGATKNYIAKPGDMILLTKSGMVVGKKIAVHQKEVRSDV